MKQIHNVKVHICVKINARRKWNKFPQYTVYEKRKTEQWKWKIVILKHFFSHNFSICCVNIILQFASMWPMSPYIYHKPKSISECVCMYIVYRYRYWRNFPLFFIFCILSHRFGITKMFKTKCESRFSWQFDEATQVCFTF